MTMTSKKEGPAKKIFERMIKDLDKAEVKIGWFRAAQYGNGLHVARVAAIQEYGWSSKGIPPRPMFRPTIDNNENKWRNQITSGMKAVANGKEMPLNVLEKVGFGISGDIKDVIVSIMDPPLKSSTIKARQRKMRNGKTIGNLYKPLVETGHLLNTVTYTVGKE